LNKIPNDKAQEYIKEDRSLVKDIVGSKHFQSNLGLIRLLNPDDFKFDNVLEYIAQTRPDLLQLLTTKEGKTWLDKNLLEIRINLAIIRNS
jgi:hypothetical protein